jgi:hypothetical protein
MCSRGRRPGSGFFGQRCRIDLGMPIVAAALIWLAAVSGLVVGCEDSASGERCGDLWINQPHEECDGLALNWLEPVAVQMPASATFSEIHADFNSSCALDTAGNGWCWGSNFAGQCGTNDTTAQMRCNTLEPSGVIRHDFSISCGLEGFERCHASPLGTMEKAPDRGLHRPAVAAVCGRWRVP